MKRGDQPDDRLFLLERDARITNPPPTHTYSTDLTFLQTPNPLWHSVLYLFQEK
jgi:hypothetical protein